MCIKLRLVDTSLNFYLVEMDRIETSKSLMLQGIDGVWFEKSMQLVCSRIKLICFSINLIYRTRLLLNLYI